MHRDFFKTVTWIGTLSATAAALVYCAIGRPLSAAGVLVGSFWMFVNGYCLMRLVEIGMAMTAAPKKNDRILLFSVLKFPVLYGAGFFILKTRVFPVTGIVIGLTIFVAAFALAWLANAKKMVSSAAAIFFAWTLKAYASEAAHHAEAAASHGAAHGGEHGGGGLHTTNLIGFVSRYLPEPAAKFLTGIENIFFGTLVIVILSVIFFFAARDGQKVPGRLRAACEAVVEWLDGFVCSIIGPQGRAYTPFLGTLFLYILTMNLIGLVPLMKSNTANSITLAGPVQLPIPTTTISLALIVFVTVQAIGIRKQGIVGYLDHMAGTPRDVFGWVMAPLMFPIHIIGEFAKPFSLTFRLFCNTMGGHVLVAVFIGMGVASMFIPFQAPFLMFEIATSTIQAFVFTLLSTVYIAMMLPHEHAEEHGHGHEHAPETGHSTVH